MIVEVVGLVRSVAGLSEAFVPPSAFNAVPVRVSVRRMTRIKLMRGFAVFMLFGNREVLDEKASRVAKFTNRTVRIEKPVPAGYFLSLKPLSQSRGSGWT